MKMKVSYADKFYKSKPLICKILTKLVGEKMLIIYGILISLWTLSYLVKQVNTENQVKENEFAHSPLFISFTLDKTRMQEVEILSRGLIYEIDHSSPNKEYSSTSKNKTVKLPLVKFTIKSGSILNVYSIVSDFNERNSMVNVKINLNEDDEVISKRIKEIWPRHPVVSGITVNEETYFYNSFLLKGTGDKNYLIMQAYDGKKQYLIDDVLGLSTQDDEIPRIFYEEYQALRQYLIEKGIDL